ncbi:MAG TPA: carboxypeptidase-like regulatory domain-containing protein, partial [Candidatus Acidoferrales bacterium]|nr:carboxypeptidase-like regulatory domain-containing protein [Candidatus Acidoferrales bacterium]
MPPALPQQQSHEPAPASSATGSISGHIYRGDTGAPLAGALVMLTSSAAAMMNGSAHPAGVRSGPDGAFGFATLGPETCTVQAQANGFVPQDFGPSVPLANGQSVSNIDLRLQPAGVVSGSVRDQND